MEVSKQWAIFLQNTDQSIESSFLWSFKFSTDFNYFSEVKKDDPKKKSLHWHNCSCFTVFFFLVSWTWPSRISNCICGKIRTTYYIETSISKLFLKIKIENMTILPKNNRAIPKMLQKLYFMTRNLPTESPVTAQHLHMNIAITSSKMCNLLRSLLQYEWWFRFCWLSVILFVCWQWLEFSFSIRCMIIFLYVFSSFFSRKKRRRKFKQNTEPIEQRLILVFMLKIRYFSTLSDFTV